MTSVIKAQEVKSVRCGRWNLTSSRLGVASTTDGRKKQAKEESVLPAVMKSGKTSNVLKCSLLFPPKKSGKLV